MDVVIGLTGKDYVMVLTDTATNRSIFNLKRDDNKIAMLDDHKVLACGGEPSSRTAFTEYISKNFALTTLKTGLELSNHAAAHFIRNELARAIRAKGGAHNAQSILGGVDENGPAMYYLDYLGSLAKVPFTAQGYCAYFSLSVMDKHWKANMTLDEGKEVMKLCMEQLKSRFIVNNPTYRLVAVSSQGTVVDEVIAV